MMAKALLLDDRDHLNKLYTINLEVFVGLQVHPFTQVESALQFLQQEGENIQLIITKSRIGAVAAAQKIQEFVALQEWHLPMVVLGEAKELEDVAVILEDHPDLKKLLQVAAKGVKVTSWEMAHLKIAEYYPIALEYLQVLPEMVCDVYREEAEGQYELEYRQGLASRQIPFNNLLHKGVLSLLIKARDRIDFVNAYTKVMVVQLSGKLSKEERIYHTEAVMRLLGEQFVQQGITDESVKLTQECMDSLGQIVGQSPQLSLLLHGLMQAQSSYRFQHCALVHFVGLKMLEKLRWNSQEQKEMMGFIAFFHDILLTSDEMAKIQTEEHMLQAKLAPAERELVQTHAARCSLLVQNYPLSPYGADVIIKQHHGNNQGSGFNLGTTQVSPMAAILLLAQEFTWHLLQAYEKKVPFDKEALLQQMQKRYSRAIFAVPMTGMRKFLQEIG